MARSPQDVRTALGANAPVPVLAEPHGPFGVLQLQAELAEQLRPPTTLLHERLSGPYDSHSGEQRRP
jgi:hypothetical protein